MTLTTGVPDARRVHPSAGGATPLAGHLLMFNLAVDQDDPVLGFATQWVTALATACGQVTVITMRAGRATLPANVSVLSAGAESGLSRPRRVARFYRMLASVLARGDVDACFSHMMPRFSALGGPMLRARRVPLITWFVHPSCTIWLRVSHAMSSRIVTAFPHSYPYRMDKVEVIGHAVDTGLFSPLPLATGRGQKRILAVGRISPSKKLDTLLSAFARVRAQVEGVTLAVVGGTPARDRAYAEGLRLQAVRLGVADLVEWVPAVPHAQLVNWYRTADVHVNLTARGFGDKVALESMSSGIPCVVANEDFRGVLGEDQAALFVPPDDVECLAGRLVDVLTLSEGERLRIGGRLRRAVEREHSIATLPARLGRVVRQVGAGGQP